MKTIKILVVDDDEDDFYIISQYIHEIPQKTFELHWANSFQKGFDKLKTQSYDLCFFDYYLGSKTGIDLLKLAKNHGVNCPIVLLTGKGDKKVDIEAMESGAMDYLIKAELDPEKLDRCIRYALERAESVAQIKSNEARLKYIFEKLSDAILLKRPQGFIFYHNSFALELFGFDSDNLKEIYFKNLFVNAQDYNLYQQLLQQQGFLENHEVWLKKKNGERILVSINVSLHLDENGKNYYLLLVKDITAQKRLEREEVLMEKSESVARLVRTLAHEVRNPLTNIHLSIDQLEPEIENEELKLFTEVIRRNVKRIDVQISDLLNSLKPQQNQFSVVLLNNFIEQTIDEAKDRIQLKNIDLVVDLGENCQLEADENKLKIALLNIIINAIEAMDSEGGNLKIEAKAQGQKCGIKISDNGCGISKENLKKLFEPYFTSKANGVGLGLASTYNIIQSHQGSIQVESELGVGTVFSIILPLKQSI